MPSSSGSSSGRTSAADDGPTQPRLADTSNRRRGGAARPLLALFRFFPCVFPSSPLAFLRMDSSSS